MQRRDFGWLLESGCFSDFLIKCGGHEWRVHRAIISSGSNFFNRMCDGSFKEAQEHHVVLSGDRPEDVARMLLFLYTEDYPHCPPSDYFELLHKLLEDEKNSFINDSSTSLITHASLYGTAEKYDCPRLKELSKSNFEIALNAKDFKISYLLPAIPIIYRTTPDSDRYLRNLVTYKCQKAHLSLEYSPEFLNILRLEPDFAIDFSFKCARKEYYWCTICKERVGIAYCKCGFNGLCGGRACKDKALDQLSCVWCGKVGGLHLDPPDEDIKNFLSQA